MNDAAHCSDDGLRALLSGAPGDDFVESAASHLDQCAACQHRLTELAGTVTDWSQAKELLQQTEQEIREEAERSARQPPSWSAAESRASWAPADSPKISEALARQLFGPPTHPEMLGRLGRYEIERMLGRGGMGIVFKAFDTELNRPVAIKLLAPHLSDSGAAKQRFAREARAAAAIVHEHVVAIHHVESEHEPPFLVMQFVSGESLQSRLDRQGPLQVVDTLRIARQLALGLAAAHEQGLVHRDVKPGNILLEEGGERALLTDFGLVRASDDASLTHSGHTPGTPHYMSPEQARGETAGQASDLFSLGSVIYAMCTGRNPFRAETSYGVMRRISDSQARSICEINAGIPQWLECVVEKLHRKSASERFQSAKQVAEVLGQCLVHLQQPGSQPLPTAVQELLPAGKRQRRLLMPALLAGTLAVGLLCWAIAFSWNTNGTSSPQQNDHSPQVKNSQVEANTAPPDTIGDNPVSAPAPTVDPTPEMEWGDLDLELQQLDQDTSEFMSRLEDSISLD